MNTKHTHWRCQYVPGSANEFRLWDENDNYLPLTSESDGEANARLIESAPELVAALERIVNINGSTGGAASIVQEYKHIAREALAKTKGE